MAILDISQLKRMLNLDVDDTTDDLYLDFILSSSESLVERYTQKKLSPVDLTALIKNERGHIVYLPYTPVNSVNSITILAVVNSSINSISQTNAIIEIIDRDFGEVYYNIGFDENTIYKIQYNAGYVEIPTDLKYAIYEIAVNMYEMTDRIKQGVDRISTSDGTFTYSKDLIPQGIRDILDLYKVKF